MRYKIASLVLFLAFVVLASVGDSRARPINPTPFWHVPVHMKTYRVVPGECVVNVGPAPDSCFVEIWVWDIYEYEWTRNAEVKVPTGRRVDVRFETDIPHPRVKYRHVWPNANTPYDKASCWSDVIQKSRGGEIPDGRWISDR